MRRTRDDPYHIETESLKTALPSIMAPAKCRGFSVGMHPSGAPQRDSVLRAVRVLGKIDLKKPLNSMA